MATRRFFAPAFAVHRLGQGVIEVIPDRPNRGQRTDLRKPLTVPNGGELRPCTKVTRRAGQRVTARPASHLRCVEDHGGGHVLCRPLPDDHPGERIDDGADVGHSGPGRQTYSDTSPTIGWALRRGSAGWPGEDAVAPWREGSAVVVLGPSPRRTPWITRLSMWRARSSCSSSLSRCSQRPSPRELRPRRCRPGAPSCGPTPPRSRADSPPRATATHSARKARTVRTPRRPSPG